MKRFIYLFSILLAVAATVVDCCPCRFTRKNAKPLTGTRWHLVQLNGRDVQFPAGTFDITFGEDGRIAGRGACNGFNAAYSTTENEGINIGTIASTRMYCPDSDTEQLLYNELDGATHYEIDGSMLLLLNNGEIRAIFSADETSDNKK